MNFKIELDLRAFQQGLSDLAKTKIPLALSGALNHTVSGARLALQKKMDETFKPKAHPYVRSGVRTSTADKNNLSAWIYISDVDTSVKGALTPAQILAPQIMGGGRATKRSEESLRSLGVMARDQFIVPGPAAKRDQYGNISGPEMIRILSAAGLMESTPGYKANQTARSRKKRGGLEMQRAYVIPHVGVFWYIPGQKISPPILFFTNRPPSYKKRFEFYETFASHVQKNFMKNLLESWGSVMLKQGYSGN